MRLKRGLAVFTLFGAFSLSLASVSCGSKKSNEGFPAPIEELNGASYENPVWTAIREKLGISAVSGVSAADLGKNLASLSTLIENPISAQAELKAQVTSVLSNVDKSVCQELKAPVQEINPGSPSVTGAYSFSGATPQALPLPAKVYLVQYKLSGDSNYRNAMVTVPVTPPATAHSAVATVGVRSETNGAYGYPLIMYAHAAAGGLAYEEIAQAFGVIQSGYIVAAPVFPGEPLCKTYDLVDGVRSTTCTGSNVLLPAVGESLPFENDVIDMMGLHDCMKTWSSGSRTVVNADGSAGTEALSTKIVKINQTAQTALASASPLASAAAGSPVTIMTGLGRGATVAGLTLARAGALNSVFFAATPDQTVIASLVAKGAKPALFSCSLLVAPQASFTSGKNKLFLDYWAKESSNILTEANIKSSELIPGFKNIHAKISGLRTNESLTTDQRTTAIASYVKDIDLLMHVPAMHGGLQNFGRQFTAQLTSLSDPTAGAAISAAAKGAMLVLHGSQDAIADVGNSELLGGLGVAVTANLITAKTAPGITWLGLAVDPPATALDASGKLAAGDYGHVSSASFLGGTTSKKTKVITSNVTTTSFEGLTPAQATAQWIGSLCTSSINASAPTP